MFLVLCNSSADLACDIHETKLRQITHFPTVGSTSSLGIVQTKKREGGNY